MKYLLDTNTCIRLLNGRSASVWRRFTSIPRQEIALCSVVQAEMLFGIERLQASQLTRSRREEFFAQYPSLPFDEAAARIYARIRAVLERQGRPIGPYDLQIAAIALVHNLILVTHNISEFSRVPDLKWEDWEVE